jgi:hypothetical protein
MAGVDPLEGRPSPLARRELLLFFSTALALGFAMYGASLTSVPLSDDFLFLSWAKSALGTIVRAVTVTSFPRMLRPLPAVLWWAAARVAYPILWLRLVALGMHAGIATLIYAAARRAEVARADAALLGGLFTAFPLAGEAVAWPSALFDVCGTLLGTLALVSPSISRRPRLLLGIAFALGLLSKESVATVPALVLFISGADLSLVAVGILVLAGYLFARWWALGALFEGYGALAPRGLGIVRQFVENLAGHVPLRVLAPWKALSYRQATSLTTVSLVFLASMAWCERRALRRWAPAIGRAVLAFVVAALPVSSVLQVGWNLDGSRMLYFPWASALLALAFKMPRPARATRIVCGTYVTFWLVCAVANDLAWRRAMEAVTRTLSAMRSFQATVHAPATVVVDAPNDVEGVFAHRNGPGEAAQAAGLDPTTDWEFGTWAAHPDLDPARPDYSELAVDGSGGPIDATACARSLESASRGMAAPEVASFVGEARSPADGILRNVDPAAQAILISTTSACKAAPPAGRIEWRDSDERPFTSDRARAFAFDAGRFATAVRLGWPDDPSAREIRLDLDHALPPGCRVELRMLRVESCRWPRQNPLARTRFRAARPRIPPPGSSGSRRARRRCAVPRRWESRR